MKRIITTLLSVFMTLSCFTANISTATVAADVWVDVDMSYEDSTKTYNRNPGRGQANTMDTKFFLKAEDVGTTYKPTAADFDERGIYTPLYDLGAFSSGNDYAGDSGNGKHLVGGTNKDIDADTLVSIVECCKLAEAQGVKLIFRFVYDQNGYFGCEPDDVKWIIRHIEQVSEILSKYAGTVLAVECGMIGPWGEMHTSKYSTAEYWRQIMTAYMDNLDPDINLLVRAAGFIVEYHGSNTGVRFMKSLPIKADDPLCRVGMYNDGYLGTNTDYGTWSGGVNLTRAQGIEFLREQNKRIPYGGELAYSSLEQLKTGRSPIYTDDFVKELYDTHLLYLRNINKSVPVINGELASLKLSDDHYFEGMPDISAYYGQNLQKFMTDHMGYRFVMRSAQVTKYAYRGEQGLGFRGTVENTGFGNLLSDMVAEVILVNEAGEYVIVPVDVDPQTWYTCETTEYNISVTVPDGCAPGSYNAFLRFGSLPYEEAAEGAATIRFANKQPVSNSFGGNYIGSFELLDHRHEWVESEKADASCFEDGYVEYICANGCGSVKNEVLPAKGEHTWSETEIVREPVCDKNGIGEHSCVLCGEYELISLEAAHKYDDEYTVDVQPTCTEVGRESRHCVNCDATTDSRVVPAIGHKWVQSGGTPANCTEIGVIVYACAHDSSHTKTETLPINGEHVWAFEDVIRETTCAKNGIVERECSLCDHYELITVPALGHDFEAEWTVDEEPTVDSEGSESRHCTRCDEVTDIRGIPKKEAVTYGDINGDGAVDATDATLFTRYANKWSESSYSDFVNLDAADVNDDGAVDATDATLLMRYVNKWAESTYADAINLI